MARPFLSKILRRTAYGFSGATVSGVAAVAGYASTEQGLGLRREILFWREVAPVVFDYWWHSSSSSPLVRLQRLSSKENTQQSPKDEETNKEKKELLEELHNRNAPRIFNIMLDLGGLYIKLGQVLSVTALPVPKQYRELFRTLQSNVPGHAEFENAIKPTLQKELGPLDDIFEFIEEIPCGAASIGQAHRARLKSKSDEMENSNVVAQNDTGSDVIVKVQYPWASWQIPADIQCVGDFLKFCVYFGVVDETAAKLSYDEFSRQFLAELDYLQEQRNLHEVYESSLDSSAPYIRRGVKIPKVFPELCTKRVITMSYLPGPKFEEEARKQLESLGIDTSLGMGAVVREAAKETGVDPEIDSSPTGSLPLSQPEDVTGGKSPWIVGLAEAAGKTAVNTIGVDTLLFLVRLARRAFLWSTAVAVRSIQATSNFAPVPLPNSLIEWAQSHKSAASQAKMLEWTRDAIDALFDVHGYQIFNQGLFNADVHPGNILVIQEGQYQHSTPNLGLIDYGQCKRLNAEEREKVAKLILSVANDESDDTIAFHFRNLGIKTKKDSTQFLGQFARLMFGPFRPHHLNHKWHRSLHKEDQVLYFPNELSMVYRTSLLLRGLAMSFQMNVSVGEMWRKHAQTVIEACQKNKDCA